jgi:hypothetical protein
MTLLLDLSPADVADTSDDCYTPRWIFDAAGLVFDMDVSAPVDPARRTCPARRYLTPIDDGLTSPWDGLVWMNPPYSNARPWAERFAQHNSVVALLPVIKRSARLGALLHRADAIALLTSIDFIGPDGRAREMPFCPLLVGCGTAGVEAVARISRADQRAMGAYYVRPAMTG